MHVRGGPPQLIGLAASSSVPFICFLAAPWIRTGQHDNVRCDCVDIIKQSCSASHNLVGEMSITGAFIGTCNL
jgi:hypothetical protein